MSNFEPLLFIPGNSVCVPHARYQSIMQQLDLDEKFRKTYSNNLQWILEYAKPNELGKTVIQAWIQELSV